MIDTRVIDPYHEKYIEDLYLSPEDDEMYRRVVLVKARSKEEALECLDDMIRSINEDLDSTKQLVLSISVVHTPISEEENSHEDTGDIGQTLRETSE